MKKYISIVIVGFFTSIVGQYADPVHVSQLRWKQTLVDYLQSDEQISEHASNKFIESLRGINITHAVGKKNVNFLESKKKAFKNADTLRIIIKHLKMYITVRSFLNNMKLESIYIDSLTHHAVINDIVSEDNYKNFIKPWLNAQTNEARAEYESDANACLTVMVNRYNCLTGRK